MTWIKVEDRVPEKGERVLCFLEYGGVAVLYLDYHENWKAAASQEPVFDVTHWMPLPEPPKLNE